MKKFILLIAFMLPVLAPNAATAADFVDKNTPNRFLGVGVRLGLTSANVSADIPGFGGNSSFSWKRGFTAGATVDLNFRNYFSIQPGFFFENRSYDYSLIEHNAGDRLLKTELGHTRSYSFTVPVMASFRFNLTGKLQWTVDAGPFFQFGIGEGKDKVEQIAVSAPENTPGSYIHTGGKRDYYGDGNWQHRPFDWGLKIGTGIKLFRHYSFNIHYQHGFRNVSATHKTGWEMRNRCWTFAVGYDF